MINRNKLRRAAKEGDTSSVKEMLKDGFDLAARFVHDWTLLHFAAKAPKPETAELLLTHGAEINALNETWDTPLDVAGHKPIADALLSRGGKNGRELLIHAASFYRDLRWVKKHVTAGHDINAVFSGQLPICIALRRHRTTVVNYLLARAVTLNVIASGC